MKTGVVQCKYLNIILFLVQEYLFLTLNLVPALILLTTNSLPPSMITLYNILINSCLGFRYYLIMLKLQNFKAIAELIEAIAELRNCRIKLCIKYT